MVTRIQFSEEGDARDGTSDDPVRILYGWCESFGTLGTEPSSGPTPGAGRRVPPAGNQKGPVAGKVTTGHTLGGRQGLFRTLEQGHECQ